MNKYIYFLYFPKVHAIKIGITKYLNKRILELEKFWGPIDINKSFYAEHKRSHRYEQAFHLLFTKYNKNFSYGDGYTEFFDPIVINYIQDLNYLDLAINPLKYYSGTTEIIGLFNENTLSSNQLNIYIKLVFFTEANDGKISFTSLKREGLLFESRIKNEDLKKYINKIILNLKEIKILKENKNLESIEIPLFNYIEIKNKDIVFSKNEFVNDVLKGFHFTDRDFEVYKELNSKYTKELYRRLRQFNRTKIWRIPIEDFIEQLDIPESYKFGHIKSTILNKSIQDLKEIYPSLVLNYIYENTENKKGRPKVKTLEFVWKENYLLINEQKIDPETGEVISPEALRKDSAANAILEKIDSLDEETLLLLLEKVKKKKDYNPIKNSLPHEKIDDFTSKVSWADEEVYSIMNKTFKTP